jgi:hypothetical protein
MHLDGSGWIRMHLDQDRSGWMHQGAPVVACVGTKYPVVVVVGGVLILRWRRCGALWIG